MGAEPTIFHNRELSKTIKYSPDPCLLFSVKGYVLAASDALYQVSGTDESIIGQLIFDVFPDNPQSPHVQAVSSLQYSFAMALQTKQPHHMPLQQYDIPKGGNPSEGFIQKFWKAVNVPILDEGGDVMFIFHKTEDITEQIQNKQHIADLTAQTEELLLQEQAARKEVEKQRNYLYELLMQLPIAISIFHGADFMVEMANPQILKFWGRTYEQVIGKPIFEAIPEAGKQGYESLLTRVLTTGEPYMARNLPVIINRGQGNEQVYFHLVYYPFRNRQGEITGVINCILEVTEQVKAKLQLEQTMKDLQETMQHLQDRNFELDQFVYKTSHDLRAPLMSILGLVSLIKQEKLPDSVGQYVDLIGNRVHKLDGFIKSTLDYSRSTRTDVDTEKIDLQGLVNESFAALELMKNFERLAISVHIADGHFYSDVFRLRIIFSNLISNAVKYMDTSKKENCLHIKIKVNHKRAIIHLKDNGMGIDTFHQDRIFGMFVRATEQSEGSGLGLYIVKQAVAALKGTITFRSTLGKGTHFLITLPNKIASFE